MVNFDAWLVGSYNREVPSSANEKWLKDLWDYYIVVEWGNITGVAPLELSDTSAVFQKAWKAAPGLPDATFDPKRVRRAIFLLRDVTQGWIKRYKTQNSPTTDNGTLCIYHAFSHVTGAGSTNALALCQSWMARRALSELPYDDSRWLQLIGIRYGFTKWCPLKGSEIPDNYSVVGTELIINVFSSIGGVPVTYWTENRWHAKLHDIQGSMDLENILADVTSTGHAIFGRVTGRNTLEFWDNENNGGRRTTSLADVARPLRCIVLSKAPSV